MILFAGNLGVQVTGSGFQPIASVAIPPGLLLSGVLRYSISGRRTSGVGSSNLRVQIGGVDLLANGSGDSSPVVFNRANCSAPPAITNQLRANGFTSRGGAASSTGLANVNLNDPLNLEFSIDLGTDSDVYTFDELTVEYLPAAA